MVRLDPLQVASKIYAQTSSPSLPTKMQKNLHQHNAHMQIFLNLNKDFSLFYNDWYYDAPLTLLQVPPRHCKRISPR